MEKAENGKNRVTKIFNILFWVSLGIIVLYSVIALFSEDDGVTTLFGGTALTVQSDSMSPTFNEGDLIFIDTEFDVEDLVVGDVITYQMLITVDDESVMIYNSHRITEIVEDSNGYLHFFTKGDNNPTADLNSITESYVLGVWNGKVYSNIGGVIDGIVGFLKSPTGFFLFIVLPCFGFLVYQIVKFIGLMSDFKTQKAIGDRVSVEEEAIAIARAQIEAEMRAKAGKEEVVTQTKKEE
ncbi:MAG: signal peptidase I [Firmicutes bacterium]|nr:signal peptidase I [Bacillota bacterium]